MSPFTTSLIEWGSTLLSLGGFWLCIQHRSSCFVVFLVADLGWFASAWVNDHSALLAQQSVYILLNIVGYVLWRKDERLREELERFEARELEIAGDIENLGEFAFSEGTPTAEPAGPPWPERSRTPEEGSDGHRPPLQTESFGGSGQSTTR